MGWRRVGASTPQVCSMRAKRAQSDPVQEAHESQRRTDTWHTHASGRGRMVQGIWMCRWVQMSSRWAFGWIGNEGAGAVADDDVYRIGVSERVGRESRWCVSAGDGSFDKVWSALTDPLASTWLLQGSSVDGSQTRPTQQQYSVLCLERWD